MFNPTSYSPPSAKAKPPAAAPVNNEFISFENPLLASGQQAPTKSSALQSESQISYCEPTPAPSDVYLLPESSIASGVYSESHGRPLVNGAYEAVRDPANHEYESMYNLPQQQPKPVASDRPQSRSRPVTYLEPSLASTGQYEEIPDSSSNYEEPKPASTDPEYAIASGGSNAPVYDAASTQESHLYDTASMPTEATNTDDAEYAVASSGPEYDTASHPDRPALVNDSYSAKPAKRTLPGALTREKSIELLTPGQTGV